ncbi:Fucose permease [Soonwooa buanensis]|uniref:Fucose permease n=1 Tax=Soonwooa buanensis TaxID=619805 RepID=A0A1T5G8W9_9FLAO|nr:MFS transporter [Soonwooa buanensis]SKC04781.1 Fucose permease [Soonwooa buanensis]
MISDNRLKIRIVFALAFLTGLNFVMFPALSPVLMSPTYFALKASAFGFLFAPQVIFIALGCMFAPFLANKFGAKLILISGLILMLLVTFVLGFLGFRDSVFQNFSKDSLYKILLCLVGLMGFGFGTSVTVLNPLAASFFQNNKASAILMLQFLVGLGTSVAPFLMFLLKDLSDWYWIPSCIAVVMFVLILALALTKIEEGDFFKLPNSIQIPHKLWMFIIIIIMYGFLEGSFGSFGIPILISKGLTSQEASLGLSLFWAGMALNRLLFGIFTPLKDLSKIFIFSPLVLALALVLFLLVNTNLVIIVSFFLIGFFMGSIFPGSIGWATVEFPNLAVLVSGVLMAANQTGTGIVTNVLGIFQNEIIGSPIIFGLILVCVLIFMLIFKISLKSKIKEAF